jgi:hypothetical protein
MTTRNTCSPVHPCLPIASSEDLVHHSPFYESPPISVPYPIPYPPLFHPPLIHLEESLSGTAPLQEAGRPYDDVDELDDLSVPEAIEDTSDDDSDSLTTPCRSATSFVNPSVDVDPASIPLPPEVRPRVYVNTDAAYLYRFELDPSRSPMMVSSILIPSIIKSVS